MGAIGVHWPGAVLAVLIILLYNGGCQADVGTPCSADPSNCTTGEICDVSTSLCACNTATHYQNGIVCVIRIKAGETGCTGITNECTDMSTCDGSTCTCIANYYDSGDTCVARIKAGETGCAGGITNECTDMSTCNSGTCTCIANYYDGGDTCVAKVVANGNCAGLPTDACRENSVCTNNKCTCNTGYYDNDGSGSSGVCVQRIKAGETGCTGDIPNECTDMSICNGVTCTCIANYYDSGDTCVAKVVANGNCAGLPTDACRENSVCTNNKCTCNTGYYDNDGSGSSGVCVQRIKAGETGCTGDIPNECTDMSICNGVTCTCIANYYDSGDTCVAKVVANGNCAGLPTDACRENSVCTNNKCTCNTGYYDNDGSGSSGVCVQRIKAGETGCTGDIPNECTDMSICNGVTCTCIANYYDSGDTCVAKVVANGNCAGLPTDACRENSVCTNNKCTCNTGYYDNDGSGSSGVCVQKVVADGNCAGLPADACRENSVCTDNKCTCNTGYYDNDGSGSFGVCVQRIKAGETGCTGGITNECTDMSTCNSGTCTCIANYYDGGDTCVAKVVANGNCAGLPTDACRENSVCTNNKCTCNTGYYDNDGSGSSGVCVQKLAISIACNSTLTGVSQCSDANAECTGNICRCKKDYYNSNGFTASSSCLSMSTLKVTSVSVTPGTDVVNVTWTPPQNINQVSGYQVIWRLGQSISGSSSTFDKTLTFATITGFTSGATYTFNVKTFETGSRTASQEVESDFSETVSMKAALSVACGTGSPTVVCEDTTTASCISNICRCNETYFDSNGFSTADGVCTSMNALKVTAVTSSSVTTTGVTISWTESSFSSQVSGYVVIWKLSTSTAEVKRSPVVTGTSTTITGLTQSTAYTFNVISQETGSRAATQEIESDASVIVTTKAELSQSCGAILCGVTNSECIAGNSAGNVCRCVSGYYDSNGYSAVGGVCTAMSGLVVTSLTVGVEGTSTVIIQWNAPSSGSDQVSRYEVHWAPSLQNGTTSYNAMTATSVRLTGFVSGQQYSFYVKSVESGSRADEQEVNTNSVTITVDAGLGVACNGGAIKCADLNSECIQNDDGTATVCRCKDSFFDSNSFSIAGGMCIAMSTLAVTDVTVVKEGTDTVNISWTSPSEYPSQVNRYEVHWTPPATINGKTFYDAQQTTAVQLVGFLPGQTYTFSVLSVESGSRSQEQNQSTAASSITMKPATPLGFTATDVDGPQITLSWTNAIGIITKYDVTTSPVLSPTATISNSITYSSGVTDGQRYNITITTVSGTELSDPLEATFRTVSKTPDPPTTPTCSETTDMSITLTWTAPSFPKGDVQYFVVNSVTTNAMFTTTSSLAQYTVTGLQPATNYAFRVATVNDAVSPHSNQSSFSLQMGCWTRAAMSQEPNTLIVSQEQSRQFTLNWTKPSITNGNLNGYRLTVFEGSTCVQEVIFKCETCTEFTSFGHTSSCQLTARQSVVILPADIEGYTYTVENLNPYINYTIHVLGVNAAGDGHPNIIYGMTEQEVPQNPTALTTEVLSSTAIRVSWAISDPEPGPTSYTLYIIPETPEQSQTVTIQGFSTRTYNVTSLQEYRTYQFNLTASTVLGTAVFQQSLPTAKTNAAAPGQVSNFQVVRPDGPNFTTVRVSWELPAILDRNSDIIKYMFSHNSTVGNLGTAPEEILVNGNPATITRNLKVLPQNIYYIEVYAVGTDQNGVIYNGNKHFVVYSAPAGSPPLDVGETVIPTSSNNNIQPTQTSFSLTLTDAFFTNSIYGGIEDMALVLCKDSCKNLGDQSEAVSSNYLVNVDGWKVARSKGYTDEYRAMSKTEFTSYINQAGTSGRRKRSTNTFVVEIGTATDCASSTETYCNGPLEAGSVYFVKAVVCTAGGCTLSALYGPYSTEKVPDSGPDVGVIIGVVCAIVAFAVIVVIIVVFIKRRQSSKPSTYKPDDEEPGLHEIEKKHITAKRPVVMERFPQHVSDLHKDSKLKFAREYEDLKELSAKHPCNAANEDGNKLKNRYVNILPFDHSRVKLNPTDPEDPSTDFINANYIPGYNSPREYIASQGPIPSTIDDFWRMIWEQQVSICVMLTLCKEDGRIKCEQYWPTERNEPKQYGDIVVEITSYSTVNTYDHRIFKITQGDQTRTLKHFHFLNWKDFSANVQNDVMIDFIQNVRAHIQPPDKKGPMIIHCSAGVGRTGTYMALDQLIQFIDEHDFSEMIDIFDLVLSMRNYRVFMVQTEQQYVFIHDCAKDLIERKKARLQNNDDDENLYVNRAYEEDPDENLYQNQNFFENKTEL